MNKFEKIKHYRGEINKLIDERPQLREFQDYIDSELKKSGNQHNRIAILENMMIEHRSKLINGLKQLVNKLRGNK